MDLISHGHHTQISHPSVNTDSWKRFYMSRFTDRNLSAFIAHNLFATHSALQPWRTFGPSKVLQNTYERLRPSSTFCEPQKQRFIGGKPPVDCLKPVGLMFMGHFQRYLDFIDCNCSWWTYIKLTDTVSRCHLRLNRKLKLEGWSFFLSLRSGGFCLFTVGCSLTRRDTPECAFPLQVPVKTQTQKTLAAVSVWCLFRDIMWTVLLEDRSDLSDVINQNLPASGMTVALNWAASVWRTLVVDVMLGLFWFWFGSVLSVSGFDVLSCRNSSVTLNVVLLEDENSPWSLKFVKDAVEMAVEEENEKNQAESE